VMIFQSWNIDTLRSSRRQWLTKMRRSSKWNFWMHSMHSERKLSINSRFYLREKKWVCILIIRLWSWKSFPSSSRQTQMSRRLSFIRKEDAKKLYSNLDFDIDTMSFQIVTQHMFLQWFSSSEMLTIYRFCCHVSVNNIVKLENRVSFLTQQQWLLEDMQVKLKQSDEDTVQLHKNVKTASTFSIDILEHATRQLLSQFALLSIIVQQVFSTISECHLISLNQSLNEDRRLFINCNVSWFVFICEVQSSEKSHILSCFIDWRNYRLFFSLSYLIDEWVRESFNIKFISRYTSTITICCCFSFQQVQFEKHVLIMRSSVSRQLDASEQRC
jgi:hypothetical protein